MAQLHSKDLKAKEKKITKLKSKNETLGRINLDLQNEMQALKAQKKKSLKGRKKGRKDEQDDFEGLIMPAKFMEENTKSRSPPPKPKLSLSKEKKAKLQSPEKADVLSPRAKTISKSGRNAEYFEHNLAQFNSMLTLAILRSKNWTREIFYCESYSCLLE